MPHTLEGQLGIPGSDSQHVAAGGRCPKGAGRSAVGAEQQVRAREVEEVQGVALENSSILTTSWQGYTRWSNNGIPGSLGTFPLGSKFRVAKDHLTGKPEITEGLLNHIEVAIRAYDPCLSCATHAVGQMQLQVQILAPDGTVRDEVVRTGW